TIRRSRRSPPNRICRCSFSALFSRTCTTRLCATDAKLDALAMQILDEGPKTLPGLVIRARAEKWLRRHLWTLPFDSLSPLEQSLCVVIDSAMRYRLRPASTSLFCGCCYHWKIMSPEPLGTWP